MPYLASAAFNVFWCCRFAMPLVELPVLNVLFPVVLGDTHLSLTGKGNPSRVHWICGVGWPAAIHLRDTSGPGCKVCSMNLYSS